jgi:hypothetical protein
MEYIKTALALIAFIYLSANVIGLILAAREYDNSSVIELGHYENWGEVWVVDHREPRSLAHGKPSASPKYSPSTEVAEEGEGA